MPKESWRYDPRWGTAIDLNGCQFGLEVNGRCNMILCNFRTTKDRAPKEPREICRSLCPREREAQSILKSPLSRALKSLNRDRT